MTALRPFESAVALVAGDDATAALMRQVALLEAQVSALAGAIHATPETRVRVNVYALVEDAIERGIRYGCARAYKHRDGSLPEEIVANVAEEGAADAMRKIGEFLELDAWEDR